MKITLTEATNPATLIGRPITGRLENGKVVTGRWTDARHMHIPHGGIGGHFIEDHDGRTALFMPYGTTVHGT